MNDSTASNSTIVNGLGLKLEADPIKILVVDDNELVRFRLTQMLSRLGYEVVAADNGEK